MKIRRIFNTALFLLRSGFITIMDERMELGSNISKFKIFNNGGEHTCSLTVCEVKFDRMGFSSTIGSYKGLRPLRVFLRSNAEIKMKALIWNP